MNGRKVPLIVSGAWQLIRFTAICVSGILLMNPTLSIGISLFLVWPAATSLVLFAAYLFAGTDSTKFQTLRGILLFGKALDVLPGIFLLGFQGAALYFGVGRPVFDTVARGFVFYYGLAGIVLLDLIFLLILLSYRPESESQEMTSHENLPEFEITRIEED